MKLSVSFSLLLALLSQAHADCDFIAKSGALASMASADCSLASSAQKNGHETCKKDGVLMAEFHWKNSKREGAGFYTDYNDNQLKFTFKNDQATGPAKVIDKNGKTLCEMTLTENKADGAVREYFESGKLKSITLYKAGEKQEAFLEFNESAKVVDLHCAEKSFTPEDQVPCHFTGSGASAPIAGKTFDQGRLTKSEGRDSKGRKVIREFKDAQHPKLASVQVFHRNGKIYESFAMEDDVYQGKYEQTFEDGRPSESAEYENGKLKWRKTYFMNGKLQEEDHLSSDGGRIDRKTYWDNAQLMLSGTFYKEKLYFGWGIEGWETLKADGQVLEFHEDGSHSSERNYKKGKLHGIAKDYSETGALEQESTYEEGIRKKTIFYDKKGAVEKVEEYYPDGSRK